MKNYVFHNTVNNKSFMEEKWGRELGRCGIVTEINIACFERYYSNS